jgi:Zn-dependent peptidase ImmA (M78 family)
LSIFKPYQFYPKQEIERRANEIILGMQAKPNFAPKWPFDASRVADFLDLAVVWEHIPPDENGSIAARIFPLERLIEINEDILEHPKGFEASTIAHEIGHWVLHINQEEADALVEQLTMPLGIEVIENPFLCRSASARIYNSSAKIQAEWIEWQANYFASCLLMPQDILKEVLEEARKGRDLTNWRHLYAIANELGVTISNLINRLQDLGWIYIPKDSKQIYPGKAAPSREKRPFG